MLPDGSVGDRQKLIRYAVVGDLRYVPRPYATAEVATRAAPHVAHNEMVSPGSADPRQRVPYEHVHDPGPTELGE